MKCQDSISIKSFPTSPSDITRSCWDPASTTDATFDMYYTENYCNPGISGQCVVKTFGYDLYEDSTDFSGSSNYKWDVIGIVRGCSTEAFKPHTAPTDTPIFTTTLTESITTRKSLTATPLKYRITYLNPHESALLARKNAQKVINNSTITMLSDKADMTRQSLLECYECTVETEDKTNNCITPNTETRTNVCDSLSCQSVTRSYKLNDVTIYYANRECTRTPEDGYPVGLSTNPNPMYSGIHDSFGYKGISGVDTIMERSITAKGNG